MYIISKFKDYYDGVVGTMGIDKTLVYERETDDAKMVEEFLHTKPFGNNYGRKNDDNPFLKIGYGMVDHKGENDKNYYESSFFVVGFCGKLYLGWKFHYKVKSGFYEETVTDIIYGYDNAKKYLRNYWKGKVQDDVNYVLKFDPIDIFRKINAPVFIFEDRMGNQGELIINPCLKDWEFYKVVDTFTAFQEISMFIGGVLGTGENEIIEVEDKYKIQQHGFDKWSFRRESEKNK